MAAEVLAKAGHKVVIAEAKPSPGRKLLMAGKSGLNLTKAEAEDRFNARFRESQRPLTPMLAEFGPAQVIDWAESLGQEVFTGSSGRIFPTAMKASPLLRAWLARLDDLGVTLHRRWRWTGWDADEALFATPDGPQRLHPAVTVLALGGASWARLGSDGAWAGTLTACGVPVSSFRPANMGLKVHWSAPMTRYFGVPIKNLALKVGSRTVRGEAMISQRGLEGGGIYAISREVREGGALLLDLMPDLRPEMVAKRFSHAQGKSSLSNYLRKSLRLAPAKVALLREFGRPMPDDTAARVALIKNLPIRHSGPRPMDEAISTAGGIRWDGLDDGLMLLARPGVFAAGEMLDWEAPTGGYLLTACLSTGHWAGRAAAEWAARQDGTD